MYAMYLLFMAMCDDYILLFICITMHGYVCIFACMYVDMHQSIYSMYGYFYGYVRLYA